MASEKHNMADISPERLALLLDRMDITDVLCRYGSIIDRCSVDQSDATLALLADCLTGDVEVDYGVGGMHKGLDAWIAFVEQSAPRMGRTLHLYTNFLINVDGDTAHALSRRAALDAGGPHSTAENRGRRSRNGGPASRPAVRPRRLGSLRRVSHRGTCRRPGRLSPRR